MGANNIALQYYLLYINIYIGNVIILIIYANYFDKR